MGSATVSRVPERVTLSALSLGSELRGVLVQPRIRRFAYVAIAILVVAIAIPATAPAGVPNPPGVVGEWDAPFDAGSVAINATLLSDGRVLLYSTPHGDGGSVASVWDPGDGSVADVSLGFPRNVFCSGQILLPDGRVIAAGGEKFGHKRVGARQTTFFDPQDDSWKQGPIMAKGRWYPTPVQLPSGRTVVFGGLADKQHFPRRGESMNASATSIRLLPRSASRTTGLYPDLHLLPNGRLLFTVAEAPITGIHAGLFDPATNRWRDTDDLIGGPRFFSNSVLLPGLQKVLVLGGTNSHSGKNGTGLKTAQVFDTRVGERTWEMTAPMEFARRDSNSVLLPDGTVLVVGGAGTGFYDDAVLAAERFDPVTETWTTVASMTNPKAHHSVGLLLPDGRVLVAGQNTETTEGHMGQVYSPPYLFAGPRPVITSVASSVGYGEPLQIQTPSAGDISRVALVRPGSTTHGLDFTQRYVDLDFTEGVGMVDALAPANGNIAPEGDYMLFVLDDDGVPSVASWVHLS